MPSLKDFLEAMSASWPVALAILLGSGAVLAADHVDLIYVQVLPAWSLGIAFVATAFAGAVLLVALIKSAIGGVSELRRRRVLKLMKVRDLETLSEAPDDEAEILLWAAQNGTQVFSAPFFDNRLKALTTKRLITAVPGQHDATNMPYYIPDHIWGALKDDLQDEPLDRPIPSPFNRRRRI